MSGSDTQTALQDLHTPTNRCFGCGPASEVGLRIKSHVENGKVVSRWQPDLRYETVYGILSGGIISSLLECQGSWATGVFLMERDGLPHVPKNFVTKEITVRFRRPVQIEPDTAVVLTSVVLEDKGREVISEAELESGGQVCARARVTSIVLDGDVLGDPGNQAGGISAEEGKGAGR